MPGFNFEGNTPNFTIASGDKIENVCLVSITATVMYKFEQFCHVRGADDPNIPLPASDIWGTEGFPEHINRGDYRYDADLDTDGNGQHMNVLGDIKVKTSCIPYGKAPVTTTRNGDTFPFQVYLKPISDYPSKYTGPGSAWSDEKKKRLGIMPKWCKDEKDSRIVDIPIGKRIDLWWPGCEGCSPKEFEDLLKADPILGGGLDGFLDKVLFDGIGLGYKGFHDNMNYNNPFIPRIWDAKGFVYP